MKKSGLLALKIFLWIIGGLLFLLLLVFVLIQVPAVQDLARKKVVSYVQGKIKTPVQIQKLSLDLPKLLVLEGVYFEDQKRDTLLAGDTLKVDISLLKLLKNQVEINEIDLRGIRANVQRSMPDSSFNFDYILKAFMGEQKKEPKPQDSTAAMKFSLDKINLDRIRVTYRDVVASSDVNFYLGHFDTRVKEFDPDKMRFDIPKIVMRNVSANLVQTEPAVKPESTAKVEADSNQPLNMDLKLGTLDLSNIRINYQNDVSALKTKLNLGKLRVDVDSINLKQQRIALKELRLADSKTLLTLGKKAQAKIVAAEVKKEVKATLNNDWRVNISELDLANNDLQFDNKNMPLQRRGLDYGHLGLKDLSLKASDFYYSLDSISGNMQDFRFRDKSGFVLNKLHTRFTYSDQGATLDDLHLETPKTILRDYISVSYPSLESITKNPGAMRINANLLNSRLGFRDILTFAPMLAAVDPFKRDPNAVMRINGNVSGSLADLSIPSLQISGLGNTRINASARIKGLPDMNRAVFDITLREFNSSRGDLNRLISPKLIPANIRLPETFNLRGTFNGGISNFKTNVLLRSSYGSAAARATMRKGKRKGSEVFNADIRMDNFNVGRLIKQENNVGRVTATAKIAGSGTDPKYMSARFRAVARRAEVKGYTYSNLLLNGNIARQNLNVKARMDDPNIRFNLDAKANIASTYPAVNMILDVDSINLQKLHLYNQDLRFHGKIAANMPSTNPDRLIGTVDASNLIVATNGKRYQMDSVKVTASADGEQRDLRLRSEFLSANLSGKYKLTEVSNALINEVNKYFRVGDGRRLPVTASQNFSFALNVTNRPILQQFVPLLTRLEPVSIRGTYNSEAGDLKVEALAPKIIYSGNTIDNVSLNVNTGGGALNYVLNLDQIATASLQLNKTLLNGKAQNNKLDLTLNVKDKGGKDKYRLAGVFSVITDQYRFSFNPNGLMLNYDNWSVAPDNFLQFGSQGILASNFSLSQSGQSLTINSNPQQPDAPLRVDFGNFRIKTLTAIAEKDSVLADGTLNGNVILSNLNTSPVFISDLLVKDFTFRADTVGDISLNVNNREANTYAADVRISGKGNDILLAGDYFVRPGNNSSFDFDLDIRNINLASVEGLTMGYLKQASGNLNGKFKVTGSPSAPQVLGDLNFNRAAFNIAMLNAYYRINDEKISFRSDGITFDTFTLLDSVGNEAVVDGKIYTSNYLDYRLGLDVTTDNFRVLSSTKKDNRLFYGTMFLNSDLRIRGTILNPAIDGSIRVNDKTNFSVVIPQSDPGIVERQGIVEFVDMDSPEARTALTSALDTLNKPGITGMDVSVNVEVDSNAIFNVIIDEGNGDFLKVQGDAQLTAGIDPSGKVTLAGTFELVNGAYELSFNFLKRRFDIQRGSTITWQGEPTTADVNVTAIYVANAAPIDLVEKQLDEPPATLNRYKQKLPFEVQLTMKGELMKPQITFDIVLPNRNYNVARDVVDNVQYQLAQVKTQPSELNKQVFALLLLNRFVAENPFANSAGGGGVESLARSSVSKILSEQLNQLAGNLIQGVDLNFDLVSSEDYTTGNLQNRTDLNVGLSKRLLNDRLKVSIGSNFELEGPKNSNQSSNNIAGNIALDYQLSKDGRYMLRAYRKNEYQGVVEGYIIETGLGFIITLDYNQFKDILARRTPEDKQRRKIEKENRKQEKKEEKQVVNIEN